MRPFKHALYGLILIGAYLFSSGCGVSDHLTMPNTASLASAAVAISDAPYHYSGTTTGTGGCWENRIKTNGPSFGSNGNSGYFCQGGGASYPAYPNATVWMGFYRDGTVSLRDHDGNDKIYHVTVPSGVACEMDLIDPDTQSLAGIVTSVNYPGIPTNVLDASAHLQYMEVQTEISGSLDSGSIWSCEYRATWGQ